MDDHGPPSEDSPPRDGEEEQDAHSGRERWEQFDQALMLQQLGFA